MGLMAVAIFVLYLQKLIIASPKVVIGFYTEIKLLKADESYFEFLNYYDHNTV